MPNKENNILNTQTQEGDFLPANPPPSTLISQKNLQFNSIFYWTEWKIYETPGPYQRTRKSFILLTIIILTIVANQSASFF